MFKIVLIFKNRESAQQRQPRFIPEPLLTTKENQQRF